MGSKPNRSRHLKTHIDIPSGIEIIQPSLKEKFCRYASSKGNLIIAGALSAATVAATVTVTVAYSVLTHSPDIHAESDTAILTACPQISDTKLVTIPSGSIEPKKRNDVYVYDKILPRHLMNPLQKMTANINLSRIAQLKRGQKLVMHVRSTGGNIETANKYSYLARRSKGTIVTQAFHDQSYVASAATVVLFSGTPGYRSIGDNTLLLIHPARTLTDKKLMQQNFNGKVPVDEENFVFEVDHTFSDKEKSQLMAATTIRNQDIRERFLKRFNSSSTRLAEFVTHMNLVGANNWLKSQYQELSEANPTQECIDAFVRDKDDIVVSPKTALKMGWVDTVYNRGWWTGLPNGTITIRANDHRAKAETRQANLN